MESFLCIDPGPKYSGIAVFENGIIVYAGKDLSLDILKSKWMCKTVLIEKIEARGMIAGNSVIDTAIMCGRFKQEFLSRKSHVVFVERRQVLSELKCKGDAEVIKTLRPMIMKHDGVKLKDDAWQAAALYYAYKDE
jgi:hypothetical protein